MIYEIVNKINFKKNFLTKVKKKIHLLQNESFGQRRTFLEREFY